MGLGTIFPLTTNAGPASASVTASRSPLLGLIGSLVVLSGGRLVGMITERDYARKIILKGKQSRETQVIEIMTTPALYVTPEHSIGQCMHLITSRRIRHLPVLEGDRVIGLVSIGDLVNWIIGAQKETIRHLHNYITGSYPA